MTSIHKIKKKNNLFICFSLFFFKLSKKYKILILGATTVIIFILFLKALNTDKVYQPNQMVNKKIPEIILEDFNNKNSKIDQNIFSQKDFVLINIWASWCVPCLIEHPFLMSLKNKNKIDIIGIKHTGIGSVKLLRQIVDIEQILLKHSGRKPKRCISFTDSKVIPIIQSCTNRHGIGQAYGDISMTN